MDNTIEHTSDPLHGTVITLLIGFALSMAFEILFITTKCEKLRHQYSAVQVFLKCTF